MMATTETLRSVLRTSRGQPILKLQSAERRASLALDLLSLGSRAALGVSFLLSVSDRLGFYGNPGERGVSWGTFERFLGYAAKVNAFAPAWMIPFLGTAATVLELLFGVTLVLDSRCGGRLSAARACSSYSVQPWRSRLGSSRHSTTLYSLRCAAPYFWVSPARIDGPSTLYYDAPRGCETCNKLYAAAPSTRPGSCLAEAHSARPFCLPIRRC